ncbi:MAG: hypothetical protein AAF525_08625 [Pseudomonadota bacterium]
MVSRSDIRTGLTGLLTAACLLSSAHVVADLYKYVNEDGVTVLDSHVPQQYVKNGYTVLSLDGRVLEVVPRALTPEEIRERDRKLLIQRAREEAERRQAEADERLLSKYSTPADVIRARDTKVSSIRSFIETSEGNLARLEGQRRSIQGTLANVERAGGTIDNASLDRLSTVENRISQILEEIEEKKAEMAEVRASFDKDLQRVRELYGESV